MVKAKESRAITRVREKLKKRLQKQSQKITPEALSKMTETIYKRFARLHAEQVPLEAERVSVFDENEHSAKVTSRAVLMLQKKLQGAPEGTKELPGRIQKPSGE